VKDEEGAAAHSVGQYLASQRKLRRISLEELSERTRIPRRNLERLESGAFDATADGFARGFVRTVAEALGLDANEAVMRLSDEPRADEVRALASARRTVLVRVGVLALLALVGLAGILVLALREPRSGDAAPETPPVTYRRDAVRGLAAESEEHRPDAPADEDAASRADEDAPSPADEGAP
jgi:cytoskeletal protein RodZ